MRLAVGLEDVKDITASLDAAWTLKLPALHVKRSHRKQATDEMHRLLPVRLGRGQPAPKPQNTTSHTQHTLTRHKSLTDV